jgi:hypothetical protein
MENINENVDKYLMDERYHNHKLTINASKRAD